ncbi:MAG: Crp/Fnr family transcriptional regulator [Rhizobiaceae bacterium]
MHAIASGSRTVACKRGEALVTPGKAKVGPIFIRSGMFSIVDWELNDEHGHIMPIFPRSIIHVESYLDDISHMSVVALKDSEALVLPMNFYREMLSRNPEWIPHFWQVSAKNSQEMLRVISGNLPGATEKRLVGFLRRYVRAYESEDGVTWPWEISQTTLASFLGASRPHLSTVLSRFKNDGAMTLTRKHLHIPETSALRRQIIKASTNAA